MKAHLAWKKNMLFECDNRGIKTLTEASKAGGGEGAAPNPKELVLNAMMGCTAIDVASILQKMRQKFTDFKMDVEAEQTSEYPTHFKTVVLKYYLSGDLDADKVKKAVDSSMTKYCGVNYMISRSCRMSYVIFLNGNEIERRPVVFVQPETN